MTIHNKYLVTGATGLIGSALVRELLKDENNIITCPVRNVQRAFNRFSFFESPRIKIIECELQNFLSSIDESYDYIIHCASPTASKYFVENPVETLTFGIETTISILDYARFNNVKGMVYISSLEVYGTIQDDSIAITEEYQGYVNPLNARSSYNMVKRTCETLCYSFFHEYGVQVKIARLTQTISPNILETDDRIFAQFGKKAADHEDIELHTIGNSAREYVFIDDAISAILTILFKGNAGEAYNVANAETYISARELAEFVQTNFNPTGKVVIRLLDDKGYAPTTKIKLDTTKIKNLGWKPNVDLKGMFKALIDNLKNRNYLNH